MSKSKIVDVIIRKTAEKTVLTAEGNLAISVSAPSVIEIHGSAQDVASYVRQGKDLLIYMKDGSVIRCNGYFLEDPQTQSHSELVFNDEQGLTHVSFAETGDAAGMASTELTAQATPITSIEPFLEQGSVLSDAPWGWIAGAALGGGAIGALLANDDGGESKTQVIDNTKEVKSAAPTFLVSDKHGDKQGVLSGKEITDDNTPTFSGTGQPGATIQVKDASGSTIASTMVGSNGTWTVKLPTQADGQHTWSVVQINGGESTGAGNITVTVATQDAALTLVTTAGDNVINASEQSAGFTLSGTSKNLAEGTSLTVKLNGKSYGAEVGAGGVWTVNVPAADAKALGDGNWTVTVTGKDAAGNTVTGNQTLHVDTHAPTLSVDTIAQDNIINAAEHNASLILSGKTNAEAGQTVTLTLNGETLIAKVASDGTWQIALSADRVKALANGDYTLSAAVSDKAGNGTSTSVDFSVDTAAPVVTFNTVGGDNILNAHEQGEAQIVSGRVQGAAAGDVVTVKLGGSTFTGAVQADGSWSVGVPSSLLKTLGEGSHAISVFITDAAGNTGNASHNITLSGMPPEFTLDTMSQDNVLNAQEARQPLALNGTSTLPDGSSVTVTLNDVDYTATVANGVWSVLVPVTDVLNLGNGLYTVTVSGADGVGNVGSAGGNLLVDTVNPQVIINTFAGDNLVSHAEATVDQTLSGRVIGAVQGDKVTVTAGGKSYIATVGNDLTWSVTIAADDLRAFGDGDLTFAASVTNGHGNTGTGERDVNINASLPGMRINLISGDDVINAIEQHQDLTITGSSSHLAQGTVIDVTINQIVYTTAVDSSGGWQIGVSSDDLKNWPKGEVDIVARANDAWGNPVSADRPIELDLKDVAVTVNTVSGDDRINAAEKGESLTLSGQTQGVEAGQTVVVKFADQTFTAKVQADGSWSLSVPATAMESLSDGRAQISVSVTNVSGNSADASHVVSVDTQAPEITLNNLTSDNIINAAEAQQDLTLSGTSDAQAGQTVTVSLNGKNYRTTVGNDGSWSLVVPAGDVGALADGNVTVTACVSDVAGNTASADRIGIVDATVPQVTINEFVTDSNTVNHSAHAQAQILSGSVTGAAAGDLVTITINDVEYTTVVDASGSWSLGLPANVIQGMADGTHTVTVSVTDRSGNTGSDTLDVVVNTVAPEITLSTIAVDDVINAIEKGADLQLSGTSNQPEGTVITVTLNGVNYTAITDASGSWSATVPASAVGGLGEAVYTVTASVTDNVGNNASASHDVTVDSSLPVVTIDTLAGDNIINAAEVAAGQTLVGKVANAAAGEIVTIVIGGSSYTATVQSDLTWSLALPEAVLKALGDGELNATASVTNAHGNTGSSSLDFTVDAALPGLRIDTVAGDDVINIIEHGQNLIISGSSSDVAANGTVTVTIMGKDYPATVQADGTWKAAVPASEVSQWADGNLTISASAVDTSGNPVTIGTLVDVDLAPVAISINTVTADNVLNAAEKGLELVLSGTTQNVQEGQTVSITFGGKAYQATVDAEGNWTYTVPTADLAGLKDGDASVRVSVTNVNGNGAAAGHEYSVDATAPTVSINAVSTDNRLNAAEAQQDLTLSGTSSAQAGQTVTVTFNGKDYTATVQADGKWTLDVPAADLAGIADGTAPIVAAVTDKAGNPASTGSSILVDTAVPQLKINTVAGDDIINQAEHGQALIISGSCTGAQAGDLVTLTLNGKTYTTVLDAAGNWSLGIPAADVGALAGGDHTISATLTDKAGNSNTAHHELDVVLSAPQVTIGTLAGDDVINALEKGADLQLSGTSNQPENTVITVTLNGVNYTAIADAAGHWTVTVPASAVSALGEANYSVTASVTDSAGNSASDSHTVLVDSAPPVVTINTVAGDNIINAAEVAAGQSISGKVSGAAAGDTVTVTVGGKTYTATVQGDLSWSVNVPADVLTALGNGTLTVTASVTNVHGNTGTGERGIAIDANLPGLRVDTVAGDDVINSIEHGQPLIVTGSSTGLTAGSTLTVTINGKSYPAGVAADGTWSAAVPAADVGALAAGSVAITVAGDSAAGNPVSITHNVTVDLADVAISINTVATDDVINAAEKGADLVLSGTTTNVQEGQSVSITFGGKSYKANVDAEGNWTYTVPAADLAGLKDGDASVQVSVTNVNGNGASASHEYSVDATAPSISISITSVDNMINAQEARADLTISGTTNAQAGQTVSVTFNGKDYTATVQADGKWTLEVPAADLAGLADGTASVTASVADKAGNPASAASSVVVDTTVPEITLDTVAKDNVINQAEHAQALVITGSATGAEAGDIITVNLNGKSYTATLDASGRWSVGVPAVDVALLPGGDYTLTATLTDKAGNSGSVTHGVSVNLDAPVLTIDTLSGDDVINSAEKGQDLLITGSATGLTAGAIVTVMLNGKAYSAIVDGDGRWSATVPAADVSALGEAHYEVSVSATNGVGNGAGATHGVNVESQLPGVIINTVAGDNVLNAAEVAAGQSISGKVTNAAAGDTVTVTVGGKTYTATVQDDLSWSVNVPADVLTALGNGELTVTASVTNGHGNTGTGERGITVDANLPGLRVDTVAGDDVINSIEHGQPLIVTGSSTGLTAGTTLTVTINGKSYPAGVAADGTWSAAVPAADVGALAAGRVTVTVAGDSAAGNPVSITHNVTVDLADVAISINTVATDDVINAAEKGADLVLSGTTAHVEAGQTVHITFGGRAYTATVDADGKWSHTVPAADLAGLKDGDARVQVSVSSVNGNGASAGHEYSVDATAPSITVNTIAGDDVLNAAEASAGLTLSGTSTAEAGQTVTVTFSGKDYTATVQTGGSWTLDVPAADLADIGDGSVTVTATVTDKAGNPASAGHNLTVDVTEPVVTINTVAGDDVINVAEHGQAQIISGSATGAAAGDTVIVTVGGRTYTTVLDAAGSWSVGVPAEVIATLQDGTATVSVTVTDKAGNAGSGTRSVTVDTGLPSLGFDAISGDNVLNAVEKGQDLLITGTSAHLAEGTVVTVNLNGKNYTATTGADGSWSLTVRASDLAGLGEANYVLSASATNGVGNGVGASSTLQVDTALPGVSINTVAGDNIINAAEVAAGQSISGKVTNAAAGDTVTVTVGGKTYTATVQGDLSWSVNVPADVLTALGNGELTVTASVTNGHGNTGTGERGITVDANLPGLRVDTVAGDDVINSIEHGQPLIVTGSSTGLTAGTTLTVTINGKSYPAGVAADGTWSAAVPAADVGALAAGSVAVTVAGDSAAGNPVSITHNVTVDLADVAISINTVATDDVINAAEKGADLVLSGTTAHVEAGQTVHITFGGRAYTATVDADGKWSHTVPAADLAGLKDGDARVQVSVSSVNGNGASAGHEYSVDATAPSISIDAVAGDNVINGSEAAAGVAISGSTSAQAGQTVTVTFNGKNYTATVQADGKWSLTVPAADLAAAADSGYTIQATVSDTAGNAGVSSKAVTLDTTAPVISFDSVAGDNVINGVEHSQAQIISGTASGATAGDRIVVTLGGQQFFTTVDANGKWSVGVPASVVSALQDGTVIITASITDGAGNGSTRTHSVQVNTAAVSLSVNTISGDDVINAVEAGGAIAITGSSSQFASGTQVTVLINGKSYTAIIQSNGSWSATVPAADAAALVEGTSYPVSVSARDNAGNSASASHTVSVDKTAPVVSIAVLSGDDVLNAAEQQQPLTVRGSTSAEAGQTVTVTLGGKTYTATVGADGSWKLDVPATDLAALGEGKLTVTASVNDKAGNGGQAAHDLTVDTVAPAVTISTVAGDDVVNNGEQQAGQTISGTTTAEQGQTVTVTFNGHTYTATAGSDGKWSVFVPGRDFLGLSDGDYTITASVTDKAGNPGDASHRISLNGDVPTITINTFAQDDIVSAAEHNAPLEISGTTSAPAGQTVTVTLNGKTYTTTVRADGSWKYTLGSADVAALADGGSYVINAQVSNAIGNGASDGHTVIVDLTAPSMGISIDSLQNDSGLSASDFITNGSKPVINGSLTARPGSGEKAQISLDGGVTWIDLVVTGTTWRYSDGRTLTDGTYVYQVRVVDNAGNVGATDSQNVTVDLTAPAAATITVDAITQDTGLSGSDFITSDNQISLKGTLGAALGAGDHAQISIDGGVTWIDVNVSGLTWTYVDGRTLSDGDYNYQLRVIDDAGNVSATAGQIVTVDTVAPDAGKTITIDSISDDTGLSGSDFITNDTTLTLYGTLGATLADGEYAQISLDGGNSWQNVTVIGTTWYYADGRTLGNATYDYWVRVVDAAGNIGSTERQSVTIDTLAPDAAITVTVDSITTDTGFDDNDFLTSETSYTLHGTLGSTLGANEYVQVSLDGGSTWVYATVNGTGWSYADSRTLANGDHSYQVRVVDQAGNVGSTTSQVVTVDTSAPQQGITIDAISEDTGRSASDFITMDTTLTVNGSLGSALAADERVQISLDGGNTWVDATVNNKQWSFTDSRDLPDGDYTYRVRIIDEAGNVGSTAQQAVTVDTTAPVTQGTVVSYTDGEGSRTGEFGSEVATDDTSPLISGTLNRGLEAGEIAEIYRDGILLGQVTMNGSTSWYYQDGGLNDGHHIYVIRVTDTAGNYTDSADFDLFVDTHVPTTTAAITARSTADNTPIISGTVSAGLESSEYLEIHVNGKTYTSQPGGGVVVDPNNNTWYLQIPDSDALNVASYTVTAQVMSSAGNGNVTGATSGSLTVANEASLVPEWSLSTLNSAYSGSYSLNEDGQWTILANQQIASASDRNSYSVSASFTIAGTYTSGTFADINRDGLADVLAMGTSYTTMRQLTNNGDGTYTNQVISRAMMGNADIWYGAIAAIDIQGDGYIDFVLGDAGGPDSRTFMRNTNGTLQGDSGGGTYGTFVSGAKVANYNSLIEASGVDLNNDGRVDIAQHTTNGSNNYALSTMINQGDGSFKWSQNFTNTMYSATGSAAAGNAVSMTWADFDGDGAMDLYMGMTYNNTAGGVMLNDGAGNLTSLQAIGSTAADKFAGNVSVAVDWDHDGKMDIIKLASSGQSYLYTNGGVVNNSLSFTPTKFGAASSTRVSNAALLDYDWDGAQDLLIFRQNGKVELQRNTNAVESGTAIHLKIVDSQGMNVYFGNTVRLYDSQGNPVASQVLNAQSGMGINDSSALVSFYGLNAGETYRAELLHMVNGVAQQTSWDGLTAGEARDSYVVTAEAATGVDGGTLTGTGYNDTFIAQDGVYTYNGGGGWTTTSEHSTWSSTGGMDTVDFRHATTGITADLSKTTAQDTGYNTSTFTNVEGIAGSNFNDVITGNGGDNQFEGRGGNDTFNIGNGGHDTLLYKLINASDTTGGNGSDVVNGFSVGTWEGTADSDRIDLRELLSDTGYTGSGSASYINGVATLDGQAGNIADYLRVVQNGSNTEIQIDRDGTGSSFDPTTVVTLNGVQTDLATLLANHQLLVV